MSLFPRQIAQKSFGRFCGGVDFGLWVEIEIGFKPFESVRLVGTCQAYAGSWPEHRLAGPLAQ